MSSEMQRNEINARQWDASFGAPVVAPSSEDFDLGYEAALPGLQALYADAAEAKARAASAPEG